MHQAPPSGPITPGAYLRRRRDASGLGLRQAAASMVAHPAAIRLPSSSAITRMALRLGAAEDDTQPLSDAQVSLLQDIFPFDPAIYHRLVAIHHAGANLAPPQLCRSCACSWFDPCQTLQGSCGWAAPDLCTACAEREAPPPAQPHPASCAQVAA